MVLAVLNVDIQEYRVFETHPTFAYYSAVPLWPAEETLYELTVIPYLPYEPDGLAPTASTLVNQRAMRPRQLDYG